MKKIFTLLFAALSIAASAQTTYNGNGVSGFGGPVGNGVLTVTDNATTINFSFTAGTLFSSNDLVIYLDTKTGGVANTSTLTDNADGGRTAISGLSGSGRTLVNFAAGFNADYAISFEPGSFAGLFDLSTPSNFGFVASAGLAGSGTGPFTFSIAKSDVGLSSAAPFTFIGTLISTSGYRSNETIGTSVTVPGSVGDTPNGGFTGTQTFSTFNTYNSSILPLSLVSFTGKIANNTVQLNWATTNEVNVSHFNIENSANGTSWTNIATVNAKNTAAAQYNQTVAASTNNLYRIKMVDKDGKASYSAIINLKNKANAISLLSNPIKGTVRVSINADAAKYTAALYSLQGKQVASVNYNHAGGVSTLEMPLNNVAKGSYIVKVATANETKSFNVIVD